ncbi:type II toxin-antitoxin system VapB family antitoxin [Thalassospira sp.]|uniref:type II toxin-antitoxin system VapB family antitoxin n=1 Tax=Thalassospira sp. TaxID=1912094 RepID=UPI001B2AAF5C|nr:type II toxin-antitoxin system VapB family antitoxin [Thalassospira sp.]MBO6807689.1 AbrB/MazE/SpoVT family DNA-binding domain-containing protein [Thalassospira sp.]MBO6840214.1 AbrB/MazE/SpoVT family DNA-binding domain-containing protein [Thalassospira sp.]
MTKASVFQNNKMQAVHLPDDVALPKGTKTVEVISVGVARVIAPSDHLWDTFFDAAAVSDDFMEDRNQPEIHA